MENQANKLYVGNLPYTASDAELRAHFEQAGEVSEVTIIMDRESGRSKGFGFVVMANEEGKNKAIEMFNGQPMPGNDRPLTVNEARPREERAPRQGGFGGNRGGGYNRDRF